MSNLYTISSPSEPTILDALNNLDDDSLWNVIPDFSGVMSLVRTSHTIDFISNNPATLTGWGRLPGITSKIGYRIPNGISEIRLLADVLHISMGPTESNYTASCCGFGFWAGRSVMGTTGLGYYGNSNEIQKYNRTSGTSSYTADISLSGGNSSLGVGNVIPADFCLGVRITKTGSIQMGFSLDSGITFTDIGTFNGGIGYFLSQSYIYPTFVFNGTSLHPNFNMTFANPRILES